MEKIEDFSDLSGLPKEKLIKLRDVALQEYIRQRQEAHIVYLRWVEITKAIENAGGENQC